MLKIKDDRGTACYFFKNGTARDKYNHIWAYEIFDVLYCNKTRIEAFYKKGNFTQYPEYYNAYYQSAAYWKSIGVTRRPVLVLGCHRFISPKSIAQIKKWAREMCS
jgi:hypothetical protein